MSNPEIEVLDDKSLAIKDQFDEKKEDSISSEDRTIRLIYIYEKVVKISIGTLASILALTFVCIVMWLLIDNIGNKGSALSKVDDYRVQFFYISASFVSILGIFATVISNVFGRDKNKNQHIGVFPVKNVTENIEQSTR